MSPIPPPEPPSSTWPVEPPPSFPPQATAPGPVPDHLVWAIVATVFNLCGVCVCLGIVGIVTGIVAILFSAQVNSKLSAGDFDGALRASRTSKILCWVTTVFAIAGILWIVYGLATGGGMAEFDSAMEQYRSKARP